MCECRHRQDDEVRISDDAGVVGGPGELAPDCHVLAVGPLLVAPEVDLAALLGGRGGEPEVDIILREVFYRHLLTRPRLPGRLVSEGGQDADLVELPRAGHQPGQDVDGVPAAEDDDVQRGGVSGGRHGFLGGALFCMRELSELTCTCYGAGTRPSFL